MSDNIKRCYPSDDFNPYKVLQWFRENRFHLGHSAKILIVGYTPRFNDYILKGFKDVFKEKGLEAPKVAAFDGFLEAETPSGTIIRFASLNDVMENHTRFHEHCEWATDLGLCNKYTSPAFLNVIRDKTPVISIFDFSGNNSKEAVDKDN